MPVAATIGAAVIGTVGTVAAANSNNRAISQASAAQQQSSAQQTALAREQMDRAYSLLEPEVQAGGRARAYADALDFGTGSYGGAPNAGGGATYSSMASEADLRQRYPDLARMWDGWESSAARTGKYTHRGVVGDNFGSYVAYEKGADAARGGGASAGTAAAPNGGAPTTVTRDQAMQQVYASAPWTINEGTFDNLDTANDQQYAGEGALIDQNYADEYGVADTNYGNTLALLDDDYAKRGGFTDAEIAAWEQIQALEADKARNSLYSRQGVTGQTGKTTRGVAEVGNEYAMNRALYEGERRRADYQPFSEGRLGADATRGAAYTDATTTRGDRRYQSYGAYSNRKANNISGRGSGQQAAYSDYRTNLDNAANRGFQARTGQASAGQTYANAASNAASRSADAAAEGAYSRANTNATLYTDLARVGSNALGQIYQQPKATTPIYSTSRPTSGGAIRATSRRAY